MSVDRSTLFIDGAWVAPSSSSRITVLNAATEALAIGSPFGGVKDSGLGREFGPEALDSYQDLKSMYIAAPAQTEVVAK